MTAIVLAAIISTLELQGEVSPGGGDYERIPFEVPEGTVEILFAPSDNSDVDVLDFGLEGPDGFRGWCGDLDTPAIVGVEESSRCYLPGAIEPGTWYVDIGKARLNSEVVSWTVTLEFRDEATAAARPRAPFEARVLESGARWYRGDFHVHSTESGDAHASFDMIRDLARSRGMDFINLSDHNTVSQHALVSAYQDGVDDLLFLRGSEVTTYGGHGTALGNPRYVEHHIGRDGHTIDALLEQVAEDGGLFLINHPVLDLGDVCIGCAWSYDDAPLDKVAGMELHTGSYDYVPVFGRQAIALWDDMLDRGYRITGTGGSDDHRAPTEPDNSESQIGSPTTLVWAEELSEAAIMEGVRQGRVVVKLRGPDDPDVELLASVPGADADGGRGMIGDTVRGAEVSLEAVVRGGDGLTLQLWRNGEVDEAVPVSGDEFRHEFRRTTGEAGDRYRLHLTEAFDVVITNHVWVEWAEPIDEGGGGCGCGAGGGAGSGAGGGLLVVLAAALVGRRRRR